MSIRKRAIWASMIAAVWAGAALANWSDSFDGGKLNLNWTFVSFPDVTKTFKQDITPGAEGNHYLTFTETTAVAKGGSAFAAGFGSNEKFKDVRVGATVNLAGDTRYNYYGLIARASYFVDPDGKMTGVAPGFVADGYILHIDYSNGPANLMLDIEKVRMNQNVMARNIEVAVPSALNARSYYAELEVVGAGPVSVTGRLYEFKGGPLVVQTPTMVDTDAKDPWEDEKVQEKVFKEGLCGIFAQNEQGDGEPAGFKCTWDDVSAVSDFLPSPSLVIDDFEGYADNAQIGAAWVDNIEGAGLDYSFLDITTVYQGYKALRLEVQNQYEPNVTEATRTFAVPQDWTAGGTDMLSLMFHGYYRDADQQDDKYHANVEQPLYAKVADDAGKEAIVTLPPYAIQSGAWHSWDIPLADIAAAGVDLKTVKKLTIGVGDGKASAQTGQDIDLVYIDFIRLGFLPKAQ